MELTAEDLTVVLCSRGLHASRVRGLLEEWTAADLLRETVWVSPEDISTSEAGPARVRASLIQSSGSHADDLFHLVGVRRLRLLRLVCVHLAASGSEVDKSLPDDASLLADALHSVLPMAADSGGGTALHRINVIVPSSGVTEIPTDLLQPLWEVNAVVSPEDRPDLDRASVFVRAPGNFAGHAAGAVASIAGLWSGVSTGCLDERDSDSATTERDVVVVRTSVRAIVGEDLSRKLTDIATERVQQPLAGPADLLSWARPARDPAGVVRQATTAVLRDGDWAATPAVTVHDPIQSERTLGDSRREAFAFNVQMFAVAARWAGGAAIRAYESTATNVLVGRSGDYVVRVQPRSPDEIVQMAQTRLLQQSEQLEHQMLVQEASTVRAPQPDTWVDLRQLCFALTDGSELPGTVQTPQMAGVRELVTPVWVAPDPVDVLETTFSLVRAGDPAGATQARAAVAAALEEARRPTSAEAGEVEEDEVVVPEVDQEEVDRLEEELVTVDQWLARRNGILLWELRRDVDQRIDGARAAADTAFKEATSGDAPAVEEVRRAERRLKRRWKLLALLLVVLLVGGYWYHRERNTDLLDLTYWSLGSLAIVLLLTVLAHHAFYKASRTYELRVQQILARRRRAAEDYVASQREASRLELLTTALLDWTDIIGWVLHRPYASSPEPERAIGEDAVLGLPAAVGVAVPSSVDAFPHSSIAAAAEILCGAGFANNRFSEVVELESVGGDADERGHLPADLDTLDAPGTPRKRLLDAFTTGEAASRLTAAARQAIGDAVIRDDLTLPPRVVRRLGHYSDGQSISDDEFFVATLGPSTPFVDNFWTDVGRMQGRHLPQSSTAWLPRKAMPQGGQPISVRVVEGDVAVRVDISRTSEPAHITCFSETVAEQRPISDPDDPKNWH